MGIWDGLSLREKVGQLFVVGFTGTEPPDSLERLLSERHVGSVILFFRNIPDAAHLARLTTSIQALAPRPLLLSADQEGGSVLRIRSGASLLPSAWALGRVGPDDARAVAEICGREMRALGLNLNLAPVLDVNVRENPGIGIRSFGEDPARAALIAAGYVQGLQSTGVLACAKHFPGKGVARLDAHLDLPVIDKTLAQLEAHELVPFRAAFDAGCAAAMTSHCLYRALDDRPATLSRAVLTGLLRERLGFEGLLITDDMEMGAISKYNEGVDAVVASFVAGADQLLICLDVALQQASIDAMVRGLESGAIPMSRLEESFARVVKAKGLIKDRPTESIEALIRRHQPVLDGILARSIEVARDPHGLLPMKGQELWVYWPDMSLLTKVEEGSAGADLVRQRLGRSYQKLHWVTYDPREPGAIERPAPGDGATVLFASANAHLFDPQARLLGDLDRTADRLVLWALRNPYDRDLVGAESTVISSFGFLPNALAATLDTLTGAAR